MKIVVLVKEVPDTYGDRRLNLETGLADRRASEPVIDEINERALEVALSYADSNPGTEVVVLSMGPDSVKATLRKGIAVGAGAAVHIVDEGLVGADMGLTAEVLAKAVTSVGFDLVIAGNQSTDGRGGLVPAMVAEFLAIPSATFLSSIEITAGSVSGERVTDEGIARISAALPAVVSVTEQLPDARLPKFKGIMASKKAPITVLTTAELGVEVDNAAISRSVVIEVAERPARATGVKIIDDGDAGRLLAAFLIQNRLA